MTHQPSITLDDRMRDAVERDVKQFKRVPMSIIESKAEEYAEKFVSQEAGLSDEEGMKQGYKKQYIELFTEELIDAINP